MSKTGIIFTVVGFIVVSFAVFCPLIIAEMHGIMWRIVIGYWAVSHSFQVYVKWLIENKLPGYRDRYLPYNIDSGYVSVNL